MGSPYLFNGLFFSLPWFYRTGYDVMFTRCRFTAGGPKRLALQRLRVLLAGDGNFAETMGQAVHDFARSSTGCATPAWTGSR